ncbi:patatin-like phospholipase family protein [Halorientalis pallida]|uniref:Patatin-like phospholipase family protein n=1 Tax=Halorientalis pallida TaxID=2479928 RepID=A0A498L4I0_9EURY|nr:patatin-like phospholipase family protein [Halorientalis pallida]RXK50147.1 patatin-like phospholipase family protein [Halorientalis pallida]
MSDEANVAIACQGGGSHTAFTAGVLGELLPAVDDRGDRLVGLSGTSGGAFAALAGWYGHLAADTTAPVVLSDLWDELAASGPADRATNDTLVWTTRLENMGVPFPEVSPHQHPFTDWGRARLRRTLESVVDFDALPGLATAAAPELVVGTVDIEGGTFETFANGDVTPEAVLASAAVPQLFPAVEIDGDEHWDGLFSQNPPIRDLYHVPPARKPDELWVVQVNPQIRDGEPTSMREIADRRNELAGNLSLNQELHTVEQINEFVAEGYLPDEEFRHTEVRRIGFGGDLGYASKLDRSPEFVDDLVEAGRERATAFLDGL